MTRALALCLCTLAAIGGEYRAHAQADERWLLVPTSAGGQGEQLAPSALTLPLEAALREAGERVLPNASAAGMFETQHSAPGLELDADELRRLTGQIGIAEQHLALGELPEAQRAMESVNALSGPARDYLTREPARARKLFDNCVMTAYLWERADQHQTAVQQMLECLRSYPGHQPEGRAYPNQVRRLYEEATLQLNQLPRVSLRVTSSGRSGCSVRTNGLPVGRTPLELTEVRTRSLRVQLECEAGAIGRIHFVELRPGDNALELDPRFDAELQTRGALWLSYADEREREQRAAADAERIARALGVERVVMLWNQTGALGVDISVRALAGDDSAERKSPELARSGYGAGEGYAHAAPARIASALQEYARSQARVVAATAPGLDPGASRSPEPEGPLLQPPAAPDRRPPAGHYSQQSAAAGALLAVLGTASLTLSWVLYAQRQPVRMVVGSADEESKYQKLGAFALATAGVGSGLLSISEYFWLPDEPGVPALAWAGGALGAGLSLGALTLALTVSDCALGDDRLECQHAWADRFFGGMLFLSALPLVTLPVCYALRSAVRPSELELSLNADLHGLPTVQLRGVF